MTAPKGRGAAGTVLLILLAASTVALILNPPVRLLARHGVPRGLAILLTYLLCIGFVVGIGVAFAAPISGQVSHLQRNVPHYVDQANRDLASLQRWLNRRGIKIQVERQATVHLSHQRQPGVKQFPRFVTGFAHGCGKGRIEAFGC